MQALYAQRHDGVDDIVIILLQCFDSLLSADIRLCHDQFNVLCLKASIINFFSIILFLFYFLGITLDRLALVIMIVIMIVAGMIASRLCCELLGGAGLGSRVEVFDLGFTKDTMLELAWLHSSTEKCTLTSKCCCLGSCRHLGC